MNLIEEMKRIEEDGPTKLKDWEVIGEARRMLEIQERRIAELERSERKAHSDADRIGKSNDKMCDRIFDLEHELAETRKLLEGAASEAEQYQRIINKVLDALPR